MCQSSKRKTKKRQGSNFLLFLNFTFLTRAGSLQKMQNHPSVKILGRRKGVDDVLYIKGWHFCSVKDRFVKICRFFQIGSEKRILNIFEHLKVHMKASKIFYFVIFLLLAEVIRALEKNVLQL